MRLPLLYRVLLFIAIETTPFMARVRGIVNGSSSRELEFSRLWTVTLLFFCLEIGTRFLRLSGGCHGPRRWDVAKYLESMMRLGGRFPALM